MVFLRVLKKLAPNPGYLELASAQGLVVHGTQELQLTDSLKQVAFFQFQLIQVRLSWKLIIFLNLSSLSTNYNAGIFYATSRDHWNERWFAFNAGRNFWSNHVRHTFRHQRRSGMPLYFRTHFHHHHHHLVCLLFFRIFVKHEVRFWESYWHMSICLAMFVADSIRWPFWHCFASFLYVLAVVVVVVGRQHPKFLLALLGANTERNL